MNNTRPQKWALEFGCERRKQEQNENPQYINQELSCSHILRQQPLARERLYRSTTRSSDIIWSAGVGSPFRASTARNAEVFALLYFLEIVHKGQKGHWLTPRIKNKNRNHRCWNKCLLLSIVCACIGQPVTKRILRCRTKEARISEPGHGDSSSGQCHKRSLQSYVKAQTILVHGSPSQVTF